MKQENKNFLYNIVYQLFSFIVPLITMPYISRVLGAKNLGISSYTYSIVYYFMLATLLGINNYGSRTIARASVSKKKDELSKQFCSIYYLQLILGIIMLITYNIIIQFTLKEYHTIMLIRNMYLVSAIVDINWFFFGMEKFKITVSRNIIIKIISLISIFIFIKTENDLTLYIFINSMAILISQLYMWIHLFRYIKLIKVKIKEIFKNLKPCIILFIPVIAYSIYRVMDKTMLGSLSSVTNLGYYENAEKIINIPMGIIAALGTVMMPNISKISDMNEIKEKIMSSFKLIFCLTIPMIFGIVIVSNDFSVMFFGQEFKESGIIMQYLAITILFSAIANVIRTHYLIPQKEDKIYVISTIVGAIINLIINLILIPKYGYVGACIGTILAEFSVMYYQIIKTIKKIDYKMVLNQMYPFLLKGITMGGTIYLLGTLINNITFKVILQIFAGAIIYFLLNYKYILFEFLNKKKIN